MVLLFEQIWIDRGPTQRSHEEFMKQMRPRGLHEPL